MAYVNPYLRRHGDCRAALVKVAAFYDAWLAGASGGNLVGPTAARTRRPFRRRIVAQLGDLEQPTFQ